MPPSLEVGSLPRQSNTNAVLRVGPHPLCLVSFYTGKMWADKCARKGEDVKIQEEGDLPATGCLRLAEARTEAWDTAALGPQKAPTWLTPGVWTLASRTVGKELPVSEVTLFLVQ